MTDQTHASHKISIEAESSNELDEPQAAHDGMGQARGQAIAEQGRYRITFEACQEVYDFFKEPEVEPKGGIGKSKTVIPGAHGCLSNISDEHRIIEDEAFVYIGKEVVRKRGLKLFQLMKALVDLRRKKSSVRQLLEKIGVCQ